MSLASNGLKTLIVEQKVVNFGTQGILVAHIWDTSDPDVCILSVINSVHLS